MKTPRTAWERLVAAARNAPEASPAEAPYGFSTRLAARAFETPRDRQTSPFVRFSWPALGLAALVMAVTVATNLKPVLASFAEDVATLSDPIVLDPDSSV